MILENLKTEHNQLQSELNNLKKRRNAIHAELKDLKAYIGTSEENEAVTGKIRDLRTDLDVIDDLISEKQSQLGEVDEAVEPLLEQEAIQQKKEKLISLAKAAGKACDQFTKERAELDRLLVKKTHDIIKQRIEWQQAAQEFAEVADTIARGFTAASERRSTPEDAEKTDQLLKELAEITDLKPVLSSYVLSTQYYPKNQNHQVDGKLFFGWLIERAMTVHIQKLENELK